MTGRQKAILEIAARGARAGETPSLEDLMRELGLTCTRQAVVCTLGVLERKGLTRRSYQLREGRIRLIVEPTPEGFRLGSL